MLIGGDRDRVFYIKYKRGGEGKKKEVNFSASIGENITPIVCKKGEGSVNG